MIWLTTALNRWRERPASTVEPWAQEPLWQRRSEGVVAALEAKDDPSREETGERDEWLCKAGFLRIAKLDIRSPRSANQERSRGC